jgi:hypothetical protein
MPTSTSLQRSPVTIDPLGICWRARSRALLRFQIEEEVILPAWAERPRAATITAVTLANRGREGPGAGKVERLRRHP